MKKLGLILVVCLLIASCGSGYKETVNVNKIIVDTLHVNVFIMGDDTITYLISSEEVLND
jgi:hypothetical protein